MRHAVEIYFDPPTEEVLRRLLEDLRTNGLPSPFLEKEVRLHVTIMVCESVDDPAAESLEGLAAGMPPKHVTLGAVGAFPGEEGAVFLAPVLNLDLLEFHHNVHELCDTLVAGRESYYTPGRWIPHCTVAYGLTPEQAGRAVQVCLPRLPIEGKFAEIGLRDVETNEVRYSFPFEG